MTTTTVSVPELRDYHYPKVYTQFLGYAEKHEMTVLREDGLYRHLRFATPGTGIGRFDLITWPGYLTIVGDIGGGWTFVREEDMFPWFYSPEGHINPSYWSEKVAGSRRDYEGYSEGQFRSYVEQRVTEAVDYRGLDEKHQADLRSQVEFEVLGEAYDQTLAYQALSGFEYHCGVQEGNGDCTCGATVDRLDSDIDPECWDDYDHHFLLACHAILWGVRQYTTEKAQERDSDSSRQDTPRQ